MIKKSFSVVLMLLFTAAYTGAAPLERVSSAEQLIPKKHQKIIRRYQKKALKYASKEQDVIDLNEFRFPSEESTEIEVSPNQFKFLLDDGYYVVWHEKVWNFRKGSEAFATEYDNQDNLIGFIKIKRINRKIFMFYEYRFSQEANTASLAHIMLLKNDKHQAAFVFKRNGELQAYQYDETVQAINFDMPSIKPLKIDLQETTPGEVALNIAGAAASVAAVPVYIEAAPVLLPLNAALWLGLMFCMIGAS